MDKINRLVPLMLIVLLVSACGIPATVTPTAIPPSNILETNIVGLAVQAQNATDIFDSVGDIITYRYTVTNLGILPLTGPVNVQDNKTQVLCPPLNTVGNLNDDLDTNEVLVCASSYAITQDDLNNRSVTNVAIANISGFSSLPVTTTVNFLQSNALTLAKTANPETFNTEGQVITYTFAIKNIGMNNLGPTQFTINDDQLGAPFNCGANDVVLLPNETISCTANYTIVRSDLDDASVINIATASGGGAVSPPAFSTITNNTIVVISPPGNLTPGTTISHTVETGEWLIQIARCYGADHKAVINANPHIPNPSFILKGQVLTIPNIGSVGPAYGRPCIGTHTVQSGDTWTSIAQRYNADVAVLQEANLRGMAVGTVLRIPLNSAGGTRTSPPTSSPTPIRITIPAGANSILLNGTLSATGRVRYVLNANQNQLLRVDVDGPANEIALAILQSNENALKPVSTTLEWEGVIPANGDYFIDIVSVLGAANKAFNLEIRLTGP